MEQRNEVLLERSEYDISNTRDLERELSVLVPGPATIDIVKVQYMDTTALRSLVRISREISSKGSEATITLKNASPSMRRIFEVVGLSRMFEIK